MINRLKFDLINNYLFYHYLIGNFNKHEVKSELYKY